MSRKNIHNTNCCVLNCHSRKGKDRSIHFHSFPKKNSGIRVKVMTEIGTEEMVDKRKAWEKILLMSKPATDAIRVCSKHFKREDYFTKHIKIKQPKLKRFAVPSQNLPAKDFLQDLKKMVLEANRRTRYVNLIRKEINSVSETSLCEANILNNTEGTFNHAPDLQ